MQQNLGIRLGTESPALRFQLRAELSEIVDFAVVGDDQPTIVQTHRLVGALGKVDDTEPAMAETDATIGG